MSAIIEPGDYPAAPAAEASGRSVVGRVAMIMGAFDEESRVLTLNDLTQRTGLPKTTVHRIAEQLLEFGWIERQDTGYAVGMRLFEVGGLATRRARLRDTAVPHLHALATQTGLAVQLGLLEGSEVLYVERIPTASFHLPTRDGGRRPAHCTALGKAMLAFDPAAVDAVIANGMTSYTRTTITSPAALHSELEEVRATGVAFDREEFHSGVACVAVPLRNSGRAIGAVSVTGPAKQVEFVSLAEKVKAAAAAIWRDRFGRRSLP